MAVTIQKRYYFAVLDSYIAITDADYFDEEECQSEWHLTELEDVLEPNFEEELEGMYATDMDVDDAIKFLKEKGFEESFDFLEILDSAFPGIDEDDIPW